MMKKNLTYVAPETEQMEIRFESNFLDSFNSGAGSASADKMSGATWSSWDAE